MLFKRSNSKKEALNLVSKYHNGVELIPMDQLIALKTLFEIRH